MGARGLTKHLLQSGAGAVQGALSQLTGRQIVIDGLNCIYGLARKHEANVPYHFDALCCALHHYGINAIIVFDGPASPARLRVQQQRRQQQYHRRKRLDTLQQKRWSHNNSIEKLSWQLRKPDQGDVAISKTIAADYGFDVLVASGEADVACASMSKKPAGLALSSDTDLLAHGAPLVIYDIQVADGTYSGWELAQVLRDLGVTPLQFQEACAIVSNGHMRGQVGISSILHHARGRHGSIVPFYAKSLGSQIVDVRASVAAYSQC